MFTLNTCPRSFRHLLYTEMLRVMHKLPNSDTRKAQLKLALAISHIQGFAPKSSIDYAAELTYESARAGNPRAQHMCKAVFDAAGLLYPPELETWLAAGVRRGSLQARWDLAEYDPAVLRSAEYDMVESRRQLGDRWLRELQISGHDDLDRSHNDGLDEVFDFFARRDGASSLHLAALTGSSRLIEELLATGFKVDLRNFDDETPLHYACISGSISAVQLLWKAGATLNAQTKLRATPMHYAILGHAPDIVQFLCEQKTDLELCSRDMEGLQIFVFSDYYSRLVGSPLAWATAYRDEDIVETLLEYGADPFCGNPQSNTPAWQLAFVNRSLNLIEMMFLKSKAIGRPLPTFDKIVPFFGDKLTTPLRLMLQRSPTRQQLIRSATDVLTRVGEEVDEIGIIFELLDIPLWHEDTVSLVEDIISKKDLQPGVSYGNYRYRNFNTGNIVICPVSLESFLVPTMQGCSIEMARMLFRHIGQLTTTVVPKVPDFEGLETIFPIALTYFDLLCHNPRRTQHELEDFVQCLLAHGADRNARSNAPIGLRENATCPLECAVQFHRVTAVAAFLNNDIGNVSKALGAALADSNSLLSLPITRLILERRPEVLRDATSAKSGTIVGAQDPKGLVAFIYILCSLNELSRNDALTEKKMRLLQRAADTILNQNAIRDAVRTTDWTGSTVLHVAATNGNRALCEILLAMGADVNQPIGLLGLDGMLSGLSTLQAISQQHDPTAEAEIPASQGLEMDSFAGMQQTTPSIPGLSSFLPKGPTPLDMTFQRDWENSLRFTPSFRDKVLELHNRAGDHKQRKDFQWRTEEVVRVLRDHGGKRSGEL
jgi:ankyrin repeat protein